MSETVVVLTEVKSEAEAAMICGYLESMGIQATYNSGGPLGPPLTGLSGVLAPQQSASNQFALSGSEVFVNSADLAAATLALSELPK